MYIFSYVLKAIESELKTYFYIALVIIRFGFLLIDKCLDVIKYFTSYLNGSSCCDSIFYQAMIVYNFLVIMQSSSSICSW